MAAWLWVGVTCFIRYSFKIWKVKSPVSLCSPPVQITKTALIHAGTLFVANTEALPVWCGDLAVPFLNRGFMENLPFPAGLGAQTSAAPVSESASFPNQPPPVIAGVTFQKLWLNVNSKCLAIVLFSPPVVCFDAKINFDDNAEFRQKEIFAMDDKSENEPIENEAAKYDLKYIGLDGNIACFGKNKYIQKAFENKFTLVQCIDFVYI